MMHFYPIRCTTLLFVFSCFTMTYGAEKTPIPKTELSFKKAKTVVGTFSSVKYIPLEERKEAFFSEISKLIVHDSLIYIMDKRGRKKILCFTLHGQFICSIGKLGRGPGEYLNLKDFDIDEDGNVHLFSTYSKKIIIYKPNGEFLKEVKTHFYINGIKCLTGGTYLFALLQISEQDGAMYCYANNDAKVISRLMAFPPEDQTNYGTDNLFKQSGDKFVSYIALRNNFSIFNIKGEPLESYHLDFGNNSFPQQAMFSHDYLVDNGLKRADYWHIDETPFLLENKLLIKVQVPDDGERWYVYDILTKEMYISSNRIADKDFNTLAISENILYIDNDVLVSSLDLRRYEWYPDKDSLPEQIVAHLKKQGIVLLLKSGLCIK